MATTSAAARRQLRCAADQPQRRGFLPLVCPTQPIIFLFKQCIFGFVLIAELVMILAVVVLFFFLSVCVRDRREGEGVR